jgi:dTDP-4-dehydrorhamnose reductase
MKRQRVIVVGASGYVGRPLFESSKKTFLTLRTSSVVKEDFILLRLDKIQDYYSIKIETGDVVLLTAAISAPDACANDYSYSRSINVNGTSAFIDYVISKGGKIIFFSSDAVYGENNKDFDESKICMPCGEYAEMKYEVENRFINSELFKSIRLSYVFSIEDKFTKYLTSCIERNVDAELFHPFFRSIVHRKDVIEGVISIINLWDTIPERVINFGGPNVVSRVDFAECARNIFFKNLCYKVTEPDSNFFKNRPRAIAMKSPIFNRVLGRSPNSIEEMMRIEFHNY